jgi:hypothetical protein
VDVQVDRKLVLIFQALSPTLPLWPCTRCTGSSPAALSAA